MKNLESVRRWPRIGSGAVIVSAVVIVSLLLFYLGNLIGWDLTWRTFGVVPLQPHFFDMHAVTDHAACTAKGFNAYVLNPCDPRTLFSYPPVWLWLGYLGIDGADSAWLSVLITIAALGVLVALLKGRSIGEGALMSLAILSPSVMMGIERGNIDLLILALVGGAALIVAEHRPFRMACAVALIGLAVVLKLHPFFCVVLAARFSRRTFFFAVALAAVSLVYFASISDYLLIIRHNAPSMSLLSYGYKVPFLGFDQLLVETGRPPTGLITTWVPMTAAILTLILAATIALSTFRRGCSHCTVANTVAGTAFLFGAGIYCGSFMLGANFTYRLIFLLLCLPQLQDWRSGTFPDRDRTVAFANVLIVAVFVALWLNGNPIFMFVPQLTDWVLFLGLTTILLANFMNSVNDVIRKRAAAETRR
jgi:hypothetical protein